MIRYTHTTYIYVRWIVLCLFVVFCSFVIWRLFFASDALEIYPLTVIGHTSLDAPLWNTSEKNQYDIPHRVVGGIGYQLVIDRWRDGNAANNVPRNPIFNPGHRYREQSERVIPRGHDWFSLTQEETRILSGLSPIATPETKRLEAGILWGRTYGGDFQGIIEKIPYLESLHVSFVFLNSPFVSGSPMGYDTEDFFHIDPRYGSSTGMTHVSGYTQADLDFMYLVQKLHAHNIKVVLDASFFYSSLRSSFVQDILKNGTGSIYYSWYSLFAPDTVGCFFSDFINTGDYPLAAVLRYGAWAQVCRVGVSLKAEQNMYASGYVNMLFSALDKRVLPNPDLQYDGIDGIRLDVFPELPLAFVQALYQRYAGKTGFVLIGEEWGNIFDPLRFTYIQMTNNYGFRGLTQALFLDGGSPLTHDNFVGFLDFLARKYTDALQLSWWNILTSHDTSRIWSILFSENQIQGNRLALEWDATERTRIQDNGTMRMDMPDFTGSFSSVQAIVALQSFFPGTMMLYYGDEAGMWGADDPSNRQPMVRDDLVYEQQSHCIPHEFLYCDPDAIHTKSPLHSNHDVLLLYQELTRLKSHALSLKFGSLEIVSNADGIFHLTRNFGKNKIHYIYNRNTYDFSYSFALDQEKVTKEFLHHGSVQWSESERTISVTIPARTATLFIGDESLASL